MTLSPFSPSLSIENATHYSERIKIGRNSWDFHYIIQNCIFMKQRRSVSVLYLLEGRKRGRKEGRKCTRYPIWQFLIKYVRLIELFTVQTHSALSLLAICNVFLNSHLNVAFARLIDSKHIHIYIKRFTRTTFVHYPQQWVGLVRVYCAYVQLLMWTASM